MTRALVLFDTSVYIPYLRGEAYTGLIEEAVRKGSVRLSSVVLAELYAGTRSAQDKADLDVVLRAYQSLQFLVIPHAMDWIRAGQTLRRYSRLYGEIEPREHMHDILILLGGHDPWVMCLGYEAWALAPSGYLDQARERLDQTLCRAQALAHPFSLVVYHEACCHVAHYCWEPQVVAEHAEAMMALATEHGFPQRLAIGQICRGWALAEQQQTEEGIAQVRRGLSTYRELGVTRMVPYFLAFLAEAALRGQQITEGLAAVNEALELTQRTGERFSEAELYRLKGELLLNAERGMRNDEQKTKKKGRASSPIHHSSFSVHHSGEAEECFQKAIEIARKQSAKLLELRATVSLSRLWQQKGKKKKEAHKMLADIYNWFTEGFDTKDLQEAKVLIEELG